MTATPTPPPSTDAEEATRRLDVRLVPAAALAWVVTACGVHGGGAAALLGCGVLGVAAGVAARAVGGAARRVLVVAALTALVGAGFAVAITLRAAAITAHPLAEASGRTVEVTVVPQESPRALRSGGRVMFAASLRAVGEAPAGGRVTVFAPAADHAALTVGQPARFRAHVGPPRRADLTVATLTAAGAPELGQAPPHQRVAAAIRVHFAAAARAALPPDQAAAVPALVLGDTSAVSPADTDAFTAAGLTHLTAVSGANVTIVCGAVLLLMSPAGPRAAVAAAAVALAGFVVLVQPSASVLRAAAMGAVTLLAVATHRRRQAVPALAATVLGLLVVTPRLAVDLGFALSVAATGALVVVAPRWSRRLEARGWPRPVAAAVAVACVAQLVTAPIVAGMAGRLSVVSVLTNIVVAPVVAPITVVGTTAAALVTVWPSGAELVLRFTGPAVWWLLGVARTAGGAAGAAVGVPDGWAGFALVGAGTAVVIRMWRHRAIRLAAAGVGVTLFAHALASALT